MGIALVIIFFWLRPCNLICCVFSSPSTLERININNTNTTTSMVILLVFSYYAVTFQATLALTDEMKLNMELSILVSN